MSKKREIFENVITKPFSNSAFVEFAKEFFTGLQLVAPNVQNNVYSSFNNYVDHYCHIGNYEGRDGERVAVLAVCLRNEDMVNRSRGVQRNFVKQLMDSGNCAGAFVAFYFDGDLTKWRLSFVRLDYEFSKGKISEKLTPAKRFSYLVGEKEPCHTAMERLFPIFEDDATNPGLNELEEAFSVEKVTKEFYEQYKAKYLALKEYLESNEQFMMEAEFRGFTSEQFAKKLMGQIVFLYFIQKKGWLGVNAIPAILSEKDFKNAMFSKGQKSRTLIPTVYDSDGTGFYRINFDKFKKLSDDEETIVANCVKGRPWGTGPKDFMRQIFTACEKAGQNYFDDYLEPLFYSALNKNRGENAYFPPLHRRIPFLNGGLFEQLDNYDWENNDFNIPNDIFSNVSTKGKRDADGILDIFDRYNFTMNEDEPLECEVAIDPEMLGKVFENLLDVKDRKSKGAFYTPREIVHYMCQETLINYLVTKTAIDEEDIRDFILYGDLMKDEDTTKDAREGNKELLISEKIFDMKNGKNRIKELDELLANVRVADLAVGSGAFPLGMLNEIVRARETLTAYMSIGLNAFDKKILYSDRKPYFLKVNTIKNCIYACDIEPSAVDISKLRLWLSIVIDDELVEKVTNNGMFDEHTKPRQLPNLDCNIICGNSLMEEFKGINLITESELLKNVSVNSQISLFQSGVDVLLKNLIEIQDKLFFIKEHHEKEELKNQIQDIYNKIILEQLLRNPDIVNDYYNSINLASRPFVLWQLYFPKVFVENKGFDIVIGNPPYVDSEEMTKSMPEMREILTKNYECARGNWDLFVLFIEKGMNLLTSKGVISFIVPNKLVAAPYTETLRKKMSKNQVVEMRDYSNVTVFKTASVYPVVFRVKMDEEKRDVVMDVMESMETVANHNVVACSSFYNDISWDKYFSSSQETLAIIDRMSKFKRLKDIAVVNGAATVGEAYLVKEFLLDDATLPDTKKFINTGGLDPYNSLWGSDYIRYLKGKYMFPVVKSADLKNMSEKRLKESNSEKIIIGGMTKILECFYDTGEYLAGKSTTIVYGCSHLKFITAVLNSKLMTFYYATYYNSMSLSGGFYRIGAPQIKELPIAIPEDSIIEEIEQYVDCILDTGVSEELVKKIDAIVYSIYGLTEQEIKIIEET